ncbi:MAG: hypothetical protein ABI690_00630 [Chloroflexota bacterium]
MHKHIGFLLAIALLLILTFGSVGADEGQDLLLVTISGNNGENIELNLYDPAADISTPLLANYTANDSAYSNAILSADGRLAFSASFEGHITAHILDTKHLDQLVTMVTNVGSADEYPLSWSPNGKLLAYQSLSHDGPALFSVWDGETSVDVTPQNIQTNVSQYFNLAWSPDGHTLAFEAYQADNQGHIYVWDGKTTVDVTPQALDSSQVYYDDLAWSSDGRLVFTVQDNLDSLSEVYVWDGHTTMSVSQNPTGNDVKPVWSTDGQLAFQSERNGAYSVLVWDGVSIKDGLPDTSTFSTVAPEVTINLSFPAWTSTGQLAFVGQSGQDRNAQIYLWDGESATNISQNPTQINANPVWNPDGRWAFTNYIAQVQYVYVKDADNQSLLMTKGSGAGKPAWSSTGFLTFCTLDEQEWVLSVWNGTEVREIARGPHVRAQWQSGGSVDCFSG